MTNKILVDEIHNEFAKQIGSDQIATKLALEIIANHLDDTCPKSILEIGSGIGTITKLLVQKMPNSVIYCYEINEWCLEQLKKNINSKNITVLKSESELISIRGKIEFLIIDDWLNKQTTFDLILQTKPESVFIEGHRRWQRLYVMQAYKNVRKSFSFKNFRKSSDSYKGGCIITDKPNALYKLIFYFGFIKITILYSKLVEIRSRISVRRIFNIKIEL
jgi:hypothetical protein